MSNQHTGPFSFNLLASREEVAIIRNGRAVLMKNPAVRSVNYHMSATPDMATTLGGENISYHPPKEIEVTVNLVATEWVEGDQESMERQLPEAVDDMNVEELLAAVNQKIEERDT